MLKVVKKNIFSPNMTRLKNTAIYGEIITIYPVHGKVSKGLLFFMGKIINAWLLIQVPDIGTIPIW